MVFFSISVLVSFRVFSIAFGVQRLQFHKLPDIYIYIYIHSVSGSPCVECLHYTVNET